VRAVGRRHDSHIAGTSRGRARRALIDAGASAVKVGIGPAASHDAGRRRDRSGPQISAISDCAVSLIAYVPLLQMACEIFGGRHEGDRPGAAASWSIAVAGTDESPGDLVLFQDAVTSLPAWVAWRDEEGEQGFATPKGHRRREARPRGSRCVPHRDRSRRSSTNSSRTPSGWLHGSFERSRIFERVRSSSDPLARSP